VKLEHSFTVPADLDTVWRAVLDPERVAPCMPGATLTEVDGDAFKGSVKVKLGPISLLYKGAGEFLEKDESSRKVVIKASGKDARGNGTAAATVTVTLKANGDTTSGSVETDLSITGKPAQFGRGLITEVGGKILDTFANCLASKLGNDESTPPTLSVVKNESEAPQQEAQTTAATTDTGKPADGTPSSANTAGGQTGSGQASDATAASEQADSEKAGNEKTAVRSAGTGTAALKSAGTGTPGAGSAGTGRANAGTAEAGQTEAAQAATGKSAGSTGERAASTGERAVAPAAEPLATEPLATSAAAAHAEAKAIGQRAGEVTAAHAPEPTKRKLAAAPEPETEPIDLLSYAGPSVLKRAAPLLALVTAVVTFIAIRRRRR
jgi:carbon monoxide dehydrogenase subunit G